MYLTSIFARILTCMRPRKPSSGTHHHPGHGALQNLLSRGGVDHTKSLSWLDLKGGGSQGTPPLYWTLLHPREHPLRLAFPAQQFQSADGIEQCLRGYVAELCGGGDVYHSAHILDGRDLLDGQHPPQPCRKPLTHQPSNGTRFLPRGTTPHTAQPSSGAFCDVDVCGVFHGATPSPI